MNIVQFQADDGKGRVAVVEGKFGHVIADAESAYQLAWSAIEAGRSLEEQIGLSGTGSTVDLDDLEVQGRLLPPISHPDPAHLFVTGTGLTHMGSADARNAMHQTQDEAELTDSMKMFRLGLTGGKPGPGETGVQPEWFYKGNGNTLAAPGQALSSPSFALDGSEEPELAGIYIIGPSGDPYRLGFAIANEFSDHVTEKQNYLYLAHSKLRQAAIGPELRIGALPDSVEGTSRIVRAGEAVWEKPFLSGERNMSHSIANLEHHHFKYDLFRQPGDVHVHMFGTATLSFSDGIRVQDGDRFEIAAPVFGRPLRNHVVVEKESAFAVRSL